MQNTENHTGATDEQPHCRVETVVDIQRRFLTPIDITVRHEDISGSDYLEIIAFAGNEQVGWIMASTCGDQIIVDLIFVRPSQRQRGVGQRLLMKLQEEARKRLCVGIVGEISIDCEYTHSMADCHAAARCFEKGGFTVDRKPEPWKIHCLFQNK